MSTELEMMLKEVIVSEYVVQTVYFPKQSV